MRCAVTKKAGNKLWIIILIIAVIGFVSGAAYFVGMKLQSDGMDDTRSAAYASSSSGTASSKTVNYVEPPVNFVELKKINKEIYAWINIPGTVIDYPILRSAADNAYYLNHTAEGKSSAYGAIYTEDYNDTDFADFNTVIYGHNMKNGTMFGSLRKFRNKEFFNSNREINIYMPGRIMKYRIFAAHTTDDRHILLSYDFKNRDVCSQYLESIFSSKGMTSYFDNDIPVTADDRIITLSTCTGKDDERYLIQGVLTYDSRKQAS
ncbi:MAG TPA: SrtB family sortase [Ruminococcaceae bacterium]|nr:SrtB family sortase [Oscillospiraceae bacterium]